MSILEDYGNLVSEIEDIQRKVERQSGRLEALMSQLKNDYKINSVKEAIAKLEEFNKSLIEKKKKIEIIFNKIDDQLDTINEGL